MRNFYHLLITLILSALVGASMTFMTEDKTLIIIFTVMGAGIACFISYFFAMVATKVHFKKYYERFYVLYDDRKSLPRYSTEYRGVDKIHEFTSELANLSVLSDYRTTFDYESSYASLYSALIFTFKRMIKDIRYINNVPKSLLMNQFYLYPNTVFDDREIKHKRLKFFYENVTDPILKAELARKLKIPAEKPKQLDAPVQVLNHIDQDLMKSQHGEYH